MDTIIGLVLGAAFAGGIVLFVMGWRGHTIRFGGGQRLLRLAVVDRRQMLLALVVAGAVALVTRWPIAAIGTAVGVFVWPRLFGGAKVAERELERIEALAVWTESLRDTIAGSISLEQAIPATCDGAPRVLVEPLNRLVGMLRGRIPLTEALTRFGDDLDDASADLVVAALILNARVRGPDLERTLSELAVHAREELELRQQVEAGRKTIRRTAKIVVGITLAFMAGMVLFSRDYVQPYSTVAGQVVLAVIAAAFAAAFMWMRKLSQARTPARYLASAEDLDDVGIRGVTS